MKRASGIETGAQRTHPWRSGLAALVVLTSMAVWSPAEVSASDDASPGTEGAADSILVALDRDAREAMTGRDLERLLDLGDEARVFPVGMGTPLIEVLAAVADLRAGSIPAAVTRLRYVSPLAVVAVIAVTALAAVLLAICLYLPIALFVWVAGERRMVADLAASTSGDGDGVPPAKSDRAARRALASWRAPLGLGAGLFLTAIDDLIGIGAAFAIAWIGFGAPESVLAIDDITRAGAISTLAGTAAGNLGTLLLVAFVYRARGVGMGGAGLAPVSARDVLRPALLLSVPLVILSAAHDLAFTKIVGREPHSNAEPLLEMLLGPAGGMLGVVAVAVTVVVTAPVIEEVVYRGVIYRAFRDRAGVPLAVFASGFIFAVAHLDMDHVLPLWWIGMTLALVVERTGSIIPAIALHALYNALSLILYLMGRV